MLCSCTQFYNDDIYNEAQVEAGNMPSIEGMGDNHPDACMLQVWKDFKCQQCAALV